ncbi:MAG: cation:proton antiporter [Pseudomonadota bacterium]
MGLLAVATFVMGFSMIANRLSGTIITAPMVFLGFGAAFGQFGMLPDPAGETALHLAAEAALIILLFLDAAQIDQKALFQRSVWPLRMLAIGLPLGFLIGIVAGVILLPDWPFALIALVAAILVPTDAALGQAVVTNHAVPERARRALTVESGMNDGLALPLILVVAAFAAPGSMAPPGGWALFAVLQVTLGPLIGGAMGWGAGHVLLWAKRTGATSDVFEGIGALALAVAAYLGATQIGGNGFIGAFAAGLGFGMVVGDRCKFVFEFTEGEGQLLSWTAFFLLGAVLVPPAIADLTWTMFGLILASLVIVRPLAIWFSLIGTDADIRTRLFFGWFGPRGLATALFALLVAEQLGHDWGEAVLHLAVNAVWISAILHGVTARFGATIFGRHRAR